VANAVSAIVALYLVSHRRSFQMSCMLSILLELQSALKAK